MNPEIASREPPGISDSRPSGDGRWGCVCVHYVVAVVADQANAKELHFAVLEAKIRTGAIERALNRSQGQDGELCISNVRFVCAVIVKAAEANRLVIAWPRPSPTLSAMVPLGAPFPFQLLL